MIERHESQHRDQLPPLATGRATIVVLACLLALVLWSRLGSITQSFWQDEAYSAVHYIDRGPAAIFHGAYIPNNHVLFSWLSWNATGILGRAEYVYRLASVLPGIAAIVMLWIHALRRFDRRVALLFAFLLATSPVHLDLVPQARGYGLAFLAGALLLVGAIEVTERRTSRLGWLAVASGGWIGIATLPVFVLPFLGQVAALGARRDRRVRSAIVCVAVLGAGALFYDGLIPQIYAARGQRFGAPLGLQSLIGAPFGDLLLRAWPARWAVKAVTLLGAGSVALGARRLHRTGRLDLLAQIAAPIVATYAALWVLGLFVVPRFVSFLVANMLLLVALGGAEAGEILAGAVGMRTVRVVAIGAATVVLALFVRLAREAHAYPYEAYREVAALVRTLAAQRTVSNDPVSAGFDFYLPGAVEYPQPAQLADAICNGSGRVVFIDSPAPAPGDGPRCAARATRIPVAQRAGGREGAAGAMAVWVVAPASPESSRSLPERDHADPDVQGPDPAR
jgi:hypothetical protein